METKTEPLHRERSKIKHKPTSPPKRDRSPHSRRNRSHERTEKTEYVHRERSKIKHIPTSPPKRDRSPHRREKNKRRSNSPILEIVENEKVKTKRGRSLDSKKEETQKKRRNKEKEN